MRGGWKPQKLNYYLHLSTIKILLGFVNKLLDPPIYRKLPTVFLFKRNKLVSAYGEKGNTCKHNS